MEERCQCVGVKGGATGPTATVTRLELRVMGGRVRVTSGGNWAQSISNLFTLPQRPKG